MQVISKEIFRFLKRSKMLAADHEVLLLALVFLIIIGDILDKSLLASCISFDFFCTMLWILHVHFSVLVIFGVPVW